MTCFIHCLGASMGLAQEAFQRPPATAEAANGLPVPAEEMVYRYNGAESPADHRYDYHWMVLRAALEKTRAKYGPYRMEPVDYLAEERQAAELQNPAGKLSVLLRGDTGDYERRFEAVWIPVDKGLLGYRVFLIRAEDQPRLTATTSLDELKSFTIGQGNGWKDIDILRANGLKVMAGGDYDGLFAMLANRRFDLFSRGVEEVLDEFEQRKKHIPSLAIEQHLLLYYPIARYFWFARSESGRRLAARVHEGMRLMVDDGSLDELFEASHHQLLEELHVSGRRLLVLHNPLVSTKAPLNDPRLWFSPAATLVSPPEKIAANFRAR